MVGEGLVAGERAFELLGGQVRPAAAAGAGPVHAPAGHRSRAVVLFAGGALARRGVAVEVAGADVEVRGVRLGRYGLALLLVLGSALLGGAVLGLVADQERIALQLALDIGLELHVRELQQLDGLLQLRRDDQALALPKLESCAKRHACPPGWPKSCLQPKGPSPPNR